MPGLCKRSGLALCPVSQSKVMPEVNQFNLVRLRAVPAAVHEDPSRMWQAGVLHLNYILSRTRAPRAYGGDCSPVWWQAVTSPGSAALTTA